MTPSRGRAALVIAAIVVGSAIAGAGIDRWVVMHSPRRRPPSALSPAEAAKRRAEMLERMTKQLSLTPAQRAGIDSIMQRADSSLRIVRGEMQPRFRRILDSSRAEIASRLDSAQRVEFAKSPPPRRPR
jgi:Spy/CpxP family protein refolding chaperone